jgi:acetyl esterase
MQLRFTLLPTVTLTFAAAVWLAAPATAQLEGLPQSVREGIAALGPTLNPEMVVKSFALMRPLQAPRGDVPEIKDLSYGDDPLQKLDVWRHNGDAAAPIVLFVHGGGFVRGDKNDYDNVPAYFARHGYLAVNMNYRLAPKVHYPAATEDLGAAVKWLDANAGKYGGDPRRIVVVGHSAGAAIVASYVLDQTIETDRTGVLGAVVVSGTFVPHAQDGVYYGSDIAARVPMAHAKDGKLPMLITQTEFDPPVLASDTHILAAAICARDGICPAFLWLSGHNHISEVASLDTRDDRLGSAIRAFVQKVAK